MSLRVEIGDLSSKGQPIYDGLEQKNRITEFSFVLMSWFIEVFITIFSTFLYH